MLVWEAHKTLSEAIGDSCSVNDQQIPDGVRFSKTLRDSYLYRAMLEIMRQELVKVTGQPRKTVVPYLTRQFPNMTRDIRLENPNKTDVITTFFLNEHLVRDIFYIYEIVVFEDPDNFNRNYPVPVKTSIEAKAKINSRNCWEPDTFAEMSDLIEKQPYIRIWDRKMEIPDSAVYSLFYLGYPLNPGSQNMIDRIDFEEAHMPRVITLASLFAYTDSQDIVNIDRYLPMSMTGGQIANNQPG